MKNKVKTKRVSLFEEKLYPFLSYGFKNPKVLLDKKTKYQKITILKTPRLGKVLLLDDVIQLSEEDAEIYHETIVHPAIFSAGKSEKVLIIGGGDGAALREVVKHKNIKEIDLVEVDKEVMKACREYLPEISNEAFDDKRVKIFHQDGAKFIKNKKNHYDVVILDTADPLGPAQSLFWSDFIQNVYSSLRTGGVFARQLGSVMLQPYEVKGSFKQTQVVFDDNVQALLTATASYLGGYYAFALGIKSEKRYNELSPEAIRRYKKSGVETDWYSEKTHWSMAVLPPYVEEMLAEEKYGEEVIIDLPGIKAPNFGQLSKWSKETCRAINMIAFGMPMKSYPKWTPESSFVQYIETSAINYRQLEKIGAANIFTCADLPVKEAIDYTLKFFNTGDALCWYLPRGSFGGLTDIKKETTIYQMVSGKKSKEVFHPRTLDFDNIKKIDMGDAPAFELVLDLYQCDFAKISSGEAVAKWADIFAGKTGLKSLGYPDAPDFGHAKKKTSGPSVSHFFEGGTNISHYSNNWLAVVINIVSKNRYDLKKAVEFSMEYFKSKRAIGWIVPRGLNQNAKKTAGRSFVFEIKQ